MTGATPSQTVGPFFRLGFDWMGAEQLVEPGSDGAVALGGRVTDGAGAPVPDAVVEIWQADAAGRLGARPGWTGFGRAHTRDDGTYRFTTVRPGPVGPGAAAHIDVSVFARGLLQRLITRIYLPEADVLAADRVLAAVPADRRATLVARQSGEGLTFDIRLQGDGETVFFAW